MNQALPYAPLNRSKLVGFLSSIQECTTECTTHSFSIRLAALIDFSDSIILFSTHRNLSAVAFDKNTVTTASAQQLFLNVRAALVESIIKSTTFNEKGVSLSNTRIRAPSLVPDEDNSVSSLLMFEPYHRFYAAHQRDMDARLKLLRSQLRDELSGYSPELAKLAELDTALDDTLLAQARKFFSVIPQLLNRHFDNLVRNLNPAQDHTDPVQWIQKGEWLELFYNRMQKLLLAELEVRLQPLLGLLEALLETSEKEVKDNS